MKKKLLLAFGVFGIINFSQAQFYLGANLNYSKYLGGSSLNSIGLGLTGEFSPDQDRSLARFGFSYGFKKSYDEEYTANAIDPYTTYPNSITVNGKSKIGFINITFDYKRFFGDGDFEAGGFYGFAGGGLSFASVSYTADSYDASKYELGFDISKKESYIQGILRLGLGYDVEMDFGNLYVEGFVNIPANTVNGAYVSIQIPMAVGLQAGLRIPLGG